ncbi:MFS transporter [Aliterella atlantica]|uniref:MFS transporter n=1 Tax=Aliterella atlantica TaxID=1827278 RepID=UPI000695AB68|nr:MFS transporter [Aliterella atlantica]
MKRGSVKAIALVAMCCALFMANLDDTVVNVALPKIQMSLDSGVSGLQWVVNAYTLTAASLLLTSGTLGDIYGRKRVLLVGLVIFTISSLICGFAPNLEILIAGRVLQGVGAAALIPSTLAIVTDTFPDPQEQTKAIGIWSAVSGIAFIAGPVLGGLLVDTLGWQSVFFLNIPMGAIAFALTVRAVKESKGLRDRRLDVPGLLLSIVILACLAYAFTEGNTGGSGALLIFAGISFGSFLWVESRTAYPMLPLPLFKNPTFAIVNVVSVLLLFTLVGLLFMFSLFLQQVQGYSAAAAGLRFLPLNGAFAIALLCSGWFAARLGWRSAITVGLVLAGVATLSFLRISPNTEYRAIVSTLVISGFGAGLALAPLTAAAMSTVISSQVGIASAILSTSNRLGGVLGVALQGTIFSQQLTSELGRLLTSWGLPANLQEQIIANALHGGNKIPANLPPSISPQALQQATNEAFVSGLHAVVLVGSIALLVGAVLVLTFVAPNFNQSAEKSPLLVKR